MVKVDFAKPSDRAEIAGFMEAAFPRAKWARDGWLTLLDARWAGDTGHYAIAARDQGRLIGVLGLVTATRPTASGWARTANMSSWYVLSDYRGQGLGQAMIACAVSAPDVTVTNFTSAKGAVPAVEAAGLVPLDRARWVWPARAGNAPLHASAPDQTDLSDRDKRVITDHGNLPPHWRVVTTPDGPVTLGMSIKQKVDAYVTYEVLYLGQPEIFADHAQAIADTVLPDHGAVLAVDCRFVPGDPAGAVREPLPMARFYSPGRLPAHQVDHLYSEIVLLDMKLP